MGARWNVAGEWQRFVIEPLPNMQSQEMDDEEEEVGPPRHHDRVLRHGDVVTLRAHTGRYVTCPMRQLLEVDEDPPPGQPRPLVATPSHAPLEASAGTAEQAQAFEVLLC